MLGDFIPFLAWNYYTYTVAIASSLVDLRNIIHIFRASRFLKKATLLFLGRCIRAGVGSSDVCICVWRSRCCSMCIIMFS